jgi:hypothetical protein
MGAFNRVTVVVARGRKLEAKNELQMSKKDAFLI